ncbi:hypothetical protein SynA15127_02338 [Synechococcus sp. A15-127]|nr:hypothetical protein SynA15127_02338 [Synechococcus sp. A15-127]
MLQPAGGKLSVCSNSRWPIFPSVVMPWCSPLLNWSNA